jgi:hypothetical protein
MERQSLPARPSLEQLRKQAKELVKNHRARDAATLALIRECLPALAGKTDEEIVLFPFALHDAQSVVARQYGFAGWNPLRDAVEKLTAAGSGRFAAEASVEEKFRTICRSYEQGDYAVFCSVMSDGMRKAVLNDHFDRVCESLAPYFRGEYTAMYFGEMSQGEHAVHFWRVFLPGKGTDLIVRMGLQNDLVSGLLVSVPFATGAPRGEK